MVNHKTLKSRSRVVFFFGFPKFFTCLLWAFPFSLIEMFLVFSLLMAEGMHIHQTALKDNEESLLKHRGIYKRIKSFPFLSTSFSFP